MLTRILLTFALVGAAALAPAQSQSVVISTYAGGPPATIPVLGVNTTIGSPAGATTDAAGNVYFISSDDGVFKLDRSGAITRVAGIGRVFFGLDYSGDGGPAINAQFNFVGYEDYYSGISGIAVDSTGNVYIADGGNHRVRKISSSGIITTIAGNGVEGASGDGGPAINAQLIYPSSLAIDSTGNLYIADLGRVRKVAPDGTITAIANGSSIAVDSAGSLYVADGNGINKIAPNGLITTVSAETPSAMTVDGSGNLYVGEGGAVRRITPAGTIVTVAGNGTCGYSGDGGQATSAQLCATALAVDGEGSLYVTDAANQRIRKISPAGVISTVAGNGASWYSGDGGPARSAIFNFIGASGGDGGVAVDGGGNLYIADTGNNRVRKISPDGIITTVAGDGISGDSGDGSPATSARLNSPSGVALDSRGNLYIADIRNNRIRKVSPSGTITTVAQSSGLALAVDGADTLYYGDALGIGTVSPTGALNRIAAGRQFNYPSALAIDKQGSLYIAETQNYRVRKLSPDGNITVVAGDGTTGYSGDGGPAAIAQLYQPSGLALDNAGNLYIADSHNFRIRMVSPSGIITTIAGNGGAGYSGDGGPATSAQFGFLTGLAIDSVGNLYAADLSSNAIRLLQPVSSSIVISGVVNAASNLAGAIAPGELIAVTGFGLGPSELVSAVPGSDGLYPTQLAGTTVEVNGIPATLIYAWGTQVAAVVPDSISGDTAQVTVTYQGRRSASFSAPVAPTAPGIFTADATGRGHAATINQNGLINIPAHWEGDMMTLFLTGAGHLTPAVAIYGGQQLPIAQGAVPGVMQINVPIPHGTDCDLPVVFQVGNASSQAGVSIAVDICI